MKPSEHPHVRASLALPLPRPEPLDVAALRRIALEAGADDCGVVELERPALADQRAELEAVLPGARSLVAFVVRMNRDAIRTPARSVSNVEFHTSSDETNEIARRIARALQDRGHRALNPAMGFPMEMDRFPGKTWVVAHKPVAVQAGLGMMGIHRNVIHPRFGNFVLLGTVITDVEVDASTTARPIDWNPCLECKLCVAACPVGAVKPDGRFDFNACYTHNYREFMSGFTAWVEEIADSKNARDYRRRVPDHESASMWQSLSFGANYKAAYCMAVCPAGEDVIGPFVHDRKRFLDRVVRPLQAKVEDVYVVAGSDAERHVAKRFPHKQLRVVGNALRARSIAGFTRGLSLRFQAGAAGELRGTYHFVFTGTEAAEVTVAIDGGRLEVLDGRIGTPDLEVTVDGRVWLDVLARQRSLLWALLSRRVRVRGPLSLLRAFGRCFPG